MIIEFFGMQIATFVDLGRALGVSTNQVYTWHNRRHSTEFPEPVTHRTSSNGLMAPWFDMEEVLEWHSTYVPHKGGYHTHKTQKEVMNKFGAVALLWWGQYRKNNPQWSGALLHREGEILAWKLQQEIARQLPDHEIDWNDVQLELRLRYIAPDGEPAPDAPPG